MSKPRIIRTVRTAKPTQPPMPSEAPKAPQAASKPQEAPKVKQAVPKATVPSGKPQEPPIPRLPVGSVFHLTYGAEGWKGALTVEGVVFEHNSRGVFGLLAKLDRMYRRSLLGLPLKGEP